MPSSVVDLEGDEIPAGTADDDGGVDDFHEWGSAIARDGRSARQHRDGRRPGQRDENQADESDAVAAGDVAQVADEHRRHRFRHTVCRQHDPKQPAEDLDAEQLRRNQRDDQVLAAEAEPEDDGEGVQRAGERRPETAAESTRRPAGR